MARLNAVKKRLVHVVQRLVVVNLKLNIFKYKSRFIRTAFFMSFIETTLKDCHHKPISTLVGIPCLTLVR